MPDSAHGLRVPPSESCHIQHASAVIHSVAQKLLDICYLTKERPFIPQEAAVREYV